jgi:hypothetical protein
VKRALRGLGAAVLLTAAAVAFAGPTGPAASQVAPSFFDHKTHADAALLGGAKPPVVYSSDGKSCNSSKCHAVDDHDHIVPPGANGHTPCIDANCHATWFLSAGVPADKNYAQAASFCLGCHASDDNQPPKPSQRVKALFHSRDSEVEFHVEMPGPAEDTLWGGAGSHFAHASKHAARTDCRTCHIVENSGLLRPGAPGHDECLGCHKASDKRAGKVKVSMGDCSDCHKAGARPNPFTAAGLPVASRQEDFITGRIDPTQHTHVTSVRSCGSEGDEALKKQGLKKSSCFRHEGGGDKQAHRFGADGKTPTQCGHCHEMIADDSVWKLFPQVHGKPVQYYSLVDLHQNPIIRNDYDSGHKACGDAETGCHSGTFASHFCSKCHSDQSAF